MIFFKRYIKNNFTGFSFFYRYLGANIFLAFILSVTVSILDGLGLSMFFPLLQVVSGEGENTSELGNLAFIVKGLNTLGLDLTLVTVLFFMVMFFALKGLAKYLQEAYIVLLRQRFIRMMRLKSLQLLNNMTFKKYITSDVGRIQNTLTGETDRVSQAFQSYLMAFQNAMMMLVYIGFAFYLDSRFAILVSIGGLTTNVLYKIIYNKTKTASRQLTGQNSVFEGEMIQHVSNFKYLKASGRVSEYGMRLKDTVKRVEDSRLRIGILNSISNAAREPLLVVIVATVIFLQVHFFYGSIGPILISLLFFYRALTSLMAMQQQWNRYMEVSGSLENVQDFQEALLKNQENNGEKYFDSFNNQIEIKKTDLFYGSVQVLKDINLTIKKNQSIALVGESGSGKTTLVSLIIGLLPPCKGSLIIDDINIRELNKESYQHRIGFVSQDPVIFNDDIYNNITFWAKKSEENLKRFNKAIMQASLQQFLQGLPEREGTQLGNNGINLSGGQKQRISIARELFKDIDILILDEATSALDSETERAIQDSIESLQGQYTLIMIAHRLSSIKNVDQIIFIDKGEIIDKGKFAELIVKQPRFKKMVELQEF